MVYSCGKCRFAFERVSEPERCPDCGSLAIHPASTTHSQMSEEELAEAGIRPGTVRLSIGTEHIDDILADLEQALK